MQWLLAYLRRVGGSWRINTEAMDSHIWEVWVENSWKFRLGIWIPAALATALLVWFALAIAGLVPEPRPPVAWIGRVGGRLVGRVGSLRFSANAGLASCFGVIAHYLVTQEVATILSQPAEVYWLSLLMAAACTVLPIALMYVSGFDASGRWRTLGRPPISRGPRCKLCAGSAVTCVPASLP